MKQILIVNSRLDSRFKPFLEKVFLAVQVGTVWEEYEDIGGKKSIADFRKQAAVADALFLVLSREAQTSFDAGNLSFFESGFSKAKDTLQILGKLLYLVVFPYLCVDLSLAEQLEYLAATAHLVFTLYSIHGKDFLPTLLFTDVIILIKNINIVLV